MSDPIVRQITDKVYGGDEPELTKYRVWWIPQIPGKPFHVEVPDLKTARLVEDTLARYDEFQYKNNIKPDYANVGGTHRWNAIENEWVDCDEEDDE